MAQLINDLVGKEPEEKTRHCDVHGEFASTGYRIGKSVRWSGCPMCLKAQEAARETLSKQRQLAQREWKIRELCGRSGIPRRFQQRSFDNFRIEDEGQRRALLISKRYADRFEERLSQGGGLIFCGRPGTGKTHLAAAIAHHIMTTGRSAAYMTVTTAIRRIKQTWRQGATESEGQAIQSFLAPDLLILDEIGVQMGSTAEKLVLFEILNGRYEDVRPTILISNLLFDEFSAFIGERIVDRMSEGGGVTVSFDWDSYRPKAYRDEKLPAAGVKPIAW